MREMEFKMEREGLVQSGQKVEISEGVLPFNVYYTIEPSVAMSANYEFSEKLQSRSGVVKDIKQTDRGFFVTVEFDE